MVEEREASLSTSFVHAFFKMQFAPLHALPISCLVGIEGYVLTLD